MRSNQNQLDVSNETQGDPWIVTAYWDGRSKTILSKGIVLAKSRREAIRAAKAGFASNASRTWAIKDCPAVRLIDARAGKVLKRSETCTP